MLLGCNGMSRLIQYVSEDAFKSNLNGYVTTRYERFNNRSVEGALGTTSIYAKPFSIG